MLCVVLSALARKAGSCGDGGLRRVRTVVRKRSDGPAPTDPPARRAVVGNRYPAGPGASPGGRPVTRVRRALCGRSWREPAAGQISLWLPVFRASCS